MRTTEESVKELRTYLDEQGLYLDESQYKMALARFESGMDVETAVHKTLGGR